MRASTEKYLLALPLRDPGFDGSVLCEFRSRLIDGGAESVLFDAVLDLARSRDLVRARGRQRTDATHILAAVRGLNRLACGTEAMRFALETLACAAPDWLKVTLSRNGSSATNAARSAPSGFRARRPNASP